VRTLCHDFRLFPSSYTAKSQTPARASVTWTFTLSFPFSSSNISRTYLILSYLISSYLSFITTARRRRNTCHSSHLWRRPTSHKKHPSRTSSCRPRRSRGKPQDHHLPQATPKLSSPPLPSSSCPLPPPDPTSDPSSHSYPDRPYQSAYPTTLSSGTGDKGSLTW